MLVQSRASPSPRQLDAPLWDGGKEHVKTASTEEVFFFVVFEGGLSAHVVKGYILERGRCIQKFQDWHFVVFCRFQAVLGVGPAGAMQRALFPEGAAGETDFRASLAQSPGHRDLRVALDKLMLADMHWVFLANLPFLTTTQTQCCFCLKPQGGHRKPQDGTSEGQGFTALAAVWASSRARPSHSNGRFACFTFPRVELSVCTDFHELISRLRPLLY